MEKVSLNQDLEQLRNAVIDSFKICIEKYWKLVFKNNGASNEERAEYEEANKLREIAQNNLQQFKDDLNGKYFNK